MINDTTSHLKLPLPHKDNYLEDDVPRLRDALTGVDEHAKNTDLRVTEAERELTRKADAAGTDNTLQALGARVDQVAGSIPKLSDAVNSAVGNVAASSLAVKTAYDRGTEGVNAAAVAQAKALDSFYPINGTATKSGSTLTLDLNTGLIFNHTFVGATTIQIANQPLNRNALIVLKMVNGGNYAITWPATIKWPSGAAPKLTANGSDEVNILFQYNGTATGMCLSDVR